MPMRICPYCNKTLSINNNFFCDNCGHKLPTTLVHTPMYPKIKTTIITASPPKYYVAPVEALSQHQDIPYSLNQASSPTTHFDQPKRLNPEDPTQNKKTKMATIAYENPIIAMLINGYEFNRKIGAMFVLILITGFGIFNLNIKETTTVLTPIAQPNIVQSKNIGVTIPRYKQASSLVAGYKDGLFDKDLTSLYIPADIDIYIELNDPEKTVIDILQPKFRDICDTSEILSMIDNNIAIFSYQSGINREWVLMGTLKEDGNQKVPTCKTTNLDIKQLDDKLIITTDKNIYAVVSAVRDNLNKNLQTNPKYILTKRQLPIKGEMLIIFFSTEAKQVLTDKLSNSVKPELLTIIDDWDLNNYNEFVVE